jgi:hypothetical protein
MDRLTRYRALVKQAICQLPHCRYGSATPQMETLFLSDESNDSYLLLALGWRGKERIFNPVLFVRIKEDKIWIEEDWTEEGIADALVRSGVPREDIVLGFQPPDLRQYTDFAIA